MKTRTVGGNEAKTCFTQPPGWVSLVGAYWLHEEDTTFGSAEDNQISIAGAEPHVGILHLEGGNVRLLPPPSRFSQQLHEDGKPAESKLLDIAGRLELPAFLTEGSLNLALLGASDRVGLVVDDSQAPGRLRYHELHWCEPDPRYRVMAQWIPRAGPKSRSVLSARGLTATLQIPGEYEFSLFGRTYNVEAALEDDKNLNLLVRDKTNPKATHGSSRYFDVPCPDRGLKAPDTLLVDLNKLRNPPCAYMDCTNCSCLLPKTLYQCHFL